MAQVHERVGSTRDEVGTLLVDHLKDLRAFARSLTKDQVSADDLVQETVVRALSSAHLFAPGTNFKAWTFTILRNAFYTEGRTNSRFAALPELDEASNELGQDKLLEMADFKRAFWQLKPDHREVLILIGPSGLSYEEVAEICGCAIGTVKSRLNRARSDLHRIMKTGDLETTRRDVAPISGYLYREMMTFPDWLTQDDRRAGFL